MRKITIKSLVVFASILLSGCASLMQTEKLHEVIREPKNYCQLKQAEKIEVTLNDITKYDSSVCSNWPNGTCINLNSKIKGRKNEFSGGIYSWGRRSGDIVIMPYPAEVSSCHRITDEICVKKSDTGGNWTFEAYDPEPYYGKRVEIMRIIKKPKLSANARQELLQKKRYEIEQKYLAEQRKNDNIYAGCNEDYDKMVNFYQNSTSIKKFCNSVEYTWFSNSCLGTKDDNERCKTLADLFIDCYRQGAIQTDDTYVSATFFNGFERGKIQLK